jgi:hypothetical protein
MADPSMKWGASLSQGRGKGEMGFRISNFGFGEPAGLTGKIQVSPVVSYFSDQRTLSGKIGNNR